jgi:hypothetical protein
LTPMVARCRRGAGTPTVDPDEGLCGGEEDAPGRPWRWRSRRVDKHSQSLGGVLLPRWTALLYRRWWSGSSHSRVACLLGFTKTATSLVCRVRKIRPVNCKTGLVRQRGGFLGSVRSRKTDHFCYRTGPVRPIFVVSRPVPNGFKTLLLATLLPMFTKPLLVLFFGVHKTASGPVCRVRNGSINRRGGFLGSVRSRKTSHFCYQTGPVKLVFAVSQPVPNSF